MKNTYSYLAFPLCIHQVTKARRESDDTRSLFPPSLSFSPSLSLPLSLSLSLSLSLFLSLCLQEEERFSYLVSNFENISYHTNHTIKERSWCHISVTAGPGCTNALSPIGVSGAVRVKTCIADMLTHSIKGEIRLKFIPSK